MQTARNIFGDTVTYCSDMYDAAAGADAAALLTEWKQFRIPDWDRLRDIMKGCVLIDGRNIYNPEEPLSAGFDYYCIGRSHESISRR